MSNKLSETTISDFGKQWSIWTEFPGWTGTVELIRDYFQPLLNLEELKGLVVAEVGAGNGRLAFSIAQAKPKQVYAVEPAHAAFQVMQQKAASRSDLPVKPVHARGEDFTIPEKLDLAYSVGVLHHIPDPDPAVRNVFHTLKPGGRFFVWIYGEEGNSLYLFFIRPLRAITSRLPHFLLVMFCYFMGILLSTYAYLCKFLPLPMRKYMCGVILPQTYHERVLTIYDQLNPAYAKYYTRDEALQLLKRAGFVDIEIYHRLEYSWSIIGTKPND